MNAFVPMVPACDGCVAMITLNEITPKGCKECVPGNSECVAVRGKDHRGVQTANLATQDCG